MDAKRKKKAPKKPPLKLSDLPFGPIAEHLSMADLGRVAQTSKEFRRESLHGQVPKIDNYITGLNRGPLTFEPLYGGGTIKDLHKPTSIYAKDYVKRRITNPPPSQYDLQRNPDTLLFGNRTYRSDPSRVKDLEGTRNFWWTTPRLTVNNRAKYSAGDTYDEAHEREAGTFNESFKFAMGKDTADYFTDVADDINRDATTNPIITGLYKSHRDKMYPGLISHHAIRAKDALEQRKLQIQDILGIQNTVP